MAGSATTGSWALDRWEPRLVARALLAVWAGLAVWHAVNASCTMDEAGHLYAGLSRWHGDPGWNNEHPPLAKSLSGLALFLAGVPRPPDTAHGGTSDHIAVLGAQLVFMQADWSWFSVLFLGRLPMLLLLLLMGGLVAWGAGDQARWGGVVALALCMPDPTITAHGTLIHTDGAAGAGAVAVAVFSERAWTRGRILDDALLGLALGLALLTKFSMLVLVPALVLVAPWRALAAERGWMGVARRLVLVAAVAWGITFVWFGSEPVQALALSLQGTSFVGRNTFLLGENIQNPDMRFFLVAFFTKTPVGHLLLLALACAAAFRRRPDPAVRRWFLMAGVVLAAYVLRGVQMGAAMAYWRYMIPVLAITYMAAGVTLAHAWEGASEGVARRWAAAVVGLLAGSAASVLAFGPSWIGYFNEPAGGARGGRRLLSDSNLDWGQDLVLLRRWMDEQDVPMVLLSVSGNALADRMGIRFQLLPAFGHVVPDPVEVLPWDVGREYLVVSAMELQGVYGDPPHFGWLAGREPDAIVGSSLWVFDITDDEESHRQVSRVYQRAGWGTLHALWTQREAMRRTRAP